MKKEVLVVLDNIRSAYNVGSIFRTADGAGVSTIFLVEVTPCPVDRFGRPQPEIVKTSLGASESIKWEHVKNEDVPTLIARLKREGIRVVGVEQTSSSVSINDFVVPDKVAYIFGNEIDGVNPTLLALADQIVDIPMQGIKESLNVSVTAGIVLFKN